MEHLTGFLIAGFALIASPGPNTLTLAAAGAAFGARHSRPLYFGLTGGMLVVMALTSTGMTGLVVTLPGAVPVVTGFSVVYFLYLAYRIATAPPLSGSAGESRTPSFALGLAVCLANPKAYAAMAALFSGFVLIVDAPVTDALTKIGLLMTMIAMVNVAWLLTGTALTRAFRDPKANRIVNVIFAGLLLGTLVLMFV